MNPNFSVHPDNFSSLMLLGLSLSHYGLMYGTNIFLARHLSLDGFDDYSVAVSVVTLLSTLATLGLEKYALRMLALNIERQAWSRISAFWRFSLRAILLTSLCLMGSIVFAVNVISAWQDAQSHPAILLYVVFLPIIALCLYMTEVITVFGAQILALSLYRVLLPISFLLLVTTLTQTGVGITAITAVLCFGGAWCLTLVCMLITLRAVSPATLYRTKASGRDWRKWLKKSLSLLVSSLMMTTLTSAGTIILEILHPSEAAVAIFAVVMQTTSLISLIGTSTNRYYLPMLVVLLERREKLAIEALLNKRLRLIAGFITIFLSVIAGWGSEILALFGSNFSQGYPALCICAGGAVFSTLFAESPYYLQFMGRNRLVITSISLAAMGMVGLSFALGRHYGATGVATAYAVPVMLLFSFLKWQAARHMRLHFINARLERNPGRF